MQGRVIIKYLDPFSSLGTKAGAPSFAAPQQGTGEPENTQLPPPSRRPCIPYLLEKSGDKRIFPSLERPAMCF